MWFDAPIGYISISKAYTSNYQKWWQPAKDTEITLYQFMAKDNVPFHVVLFPSMLLGCNRGYITVSHIMATGMVTKHFIIWKQTSATFKWFPKFFNSHLLQKDFE